MVPWPSRDWWDSRGRGRSDHQRDFDRPQRNEYCVDSEEPSSSTVATSMSITTSMGLWRGLDRGGGIIGVVSCGCPKSEYNEQCGSGIVTGGARRARTSHFGSIQRRCMGVKEGSFLDRVTPGGGVVAHSPERYRSCQGEAATNGGEGK